MKGEEPLMNLRMYRLYRIIICSILILIISGVDIIASRAGYFVFTQVRYNGEWDPYSRAWLEIWGYLNATTSVAAKKERRIISLKDPLLFSSPFVYIAGQNSFPPWSNEERENLKRYLLAGGLLVIDDTGGGVSFGFERSIKREMRAIFPDMEMTKIPLNHALFRSYYLIRQVGGRRISRTYLDALWSGGRISVIYSSNDLMGVWSRDHLGNWVKECIPGGEHQRLEGMKLMLNIIIFSLTGTYKSDRIHQPFIERKLEK